MSAGYQQKSAIRFGEFELDPKYALAWSGLADAYNMDGFYGLAHPEVCLPAANEAAQQQDEAIHWVQEAHAIGDPSIRRR